MFEKVTAILADYKDISPAVISPETTFQSLSLDSLDTVELLMRIEDELELSVEMNESLKTVGDLVAALEAAKA